VSWYFELSRRKKFYQWEVPFKGTISEFIRDDSYGLQRIIHYYSIWEKNQSVPERFLLLRYEDLHENPHSELERVLGFFDIATSTEIVDKAVAYAGFENMRKLEVEDTFQSANLRPSNHADKESYKVRKGKIGGYSEYLSAEDIAYMNAMLAKHPCPFYPELTETVTQTSHAEAH
jgi:hypothetical protein